MKLVIQNPQFLSDTRTTRVHDYVIELLIRFRPAIRIWPLQNLPQWYRFLWLKKLPLNGWTYVFREEEMKDYDVWINFNAKARQGTKRDPMPKKFSGLKLLHLMDYSYHPAADEERLRQAKIDYVFGYARHDLHCAFYRKMHPSLNGRVVPVPFGYLPRFRETIPFDQKDNRCSVMGAVYPFPKSSEAEPDLRDYLTFFAGQKCAHELRWQVREEAARLQDSIVSFLPKPDENVTWSYNSALELDRHRFFLNDDSLMHYPPARTYEGIRSGSIMLAADEPVYRDFAFAHNRNCLLFKSGDFDDMLRTLREAQQDLARCQAIHDEMKSFADRFSHRNVGTSLHKQIELLWQGKADQALNYWSRPQIPKGA